MRALLTFPNPVNEKAARTVAAGVLALSALTLITGWYWLTIPLAYGFWARVLTGPTLSPLGWSAQNLIAPRAGSRAARSRPAEAVRPGDRCGDVVGGARARPGARAQNRRRRRAGAARRGGGLESILGLCLGCRVFAMLMALGLVPESVCAECADISGRLARAGS